MAEDMPSLKFVCFRVFFYLCLAHLSSASCENNAVGIADGSVYLNASSEQSASTPANNGRLNYTAGSSWCASTSDSNPYLQINLRTLYIICAVSTQGNSKADQWVRNYTLQSSTDGINWTDYKEDGQISKKSFKGNYDRNSAVKHILYNGIVARYLRFIVESNHSGACFRVEIFGVPRSKVNIAFLKPTSQSSTLREFFSSKAVDGVKSNHHTQCTHTQGGGSTNPWWRVDLQSEQPVAEVRILNRGDCCAGRLNGAEIRVGNSDANGVANQLCGTVTSISAGQEKSFFCIPRAYGRYVYIRIPGSGKTLTLCEVEVYSTYISRTNLALNQPTDQISTGASGVARRAVDGGTSTNYDDGSCTHTIATIDPWWRVDLRSSVPVTEVRIVNRACGNACGSRLSSFEIRIGNRNQSGGQTNPSCGGNLSLSSGQTKSFYCKPVLVGRFVFVRIPGSSKILTLCEVQVYSETRTSNGVKGCSGDPVGISDSSIILDQRFSASSTRGSRNPYNGRLRNGSNSWMPSSNNDGRDFLQIDLGSIYFVCGVATQGNPSADDWTKTYKIETSLNNVNWTIYVENHVEKNFTGNSDKNSVVRSELYQPVAAKFIRFYPVLFNNNKALRVEVYGSLQGCLSSIGNERFVVRTLGTTASSELDNNHRAGWSRLYGSNSWCSASVSLPQYLQFDAKKVITVSGVATQGDNLVGKWVTSYAISYGYDGQKWFDYLGGRILTGNINNGSIVVNFLSSPFAAQFIRILPKTYSTGICMRVDLLVCESFQVPFLFVDLDDAVLPAASGGSVVLNCNTLVSNQRPPAAYKWTKGRTVLPETSSSFTITYTSATEINNNYQCARKGSSVRDFQCNATYQCSTSLVDLPEIKDEAKGNVTVILKIPGKPVVQVNQVDVQARSTLVRWSYSSPAADEAPIDFFTLHYQNNTFGDDIVVSDGSVSRQLNHLKPYSLYSVRVNATSVLGTGDWSNLVNFTTSTATPEVTVQVDNVTAVSSQTIYVKWTQPSFDKLNGPRAGFMYTIAYRKEGSSVDQTFNASESATSHTIQNLNKWTVYRVKMRVNNRDFPGSWSPEKETRTHQDAPSAPQNLQFDLSKPTENTRPRMTVTWGKPTTENGIIKRYTLGYSYNYDGKVMSSQHTTNNRTLSYSFDVLGGLNYTVTVRAETIKAGPNATGTQQVPEYRPSIAPQNIISQKISETTYKIIWDPLSREKSNGVVKAYEVERNRSASSTNAEGVVLQNTTEAFAMLHGLTSCSTYKVKVRAYTSAGPGNFGSLPDDIVTTAPGPPSDVTTENTEKRTVTLRWNKPARHGNDVQKYTVIFEGKKDYYPVFKHADKLETTSLTLAVQNLYPGTKYNFVIIATTHCGPGENSTVVSSETPKDAPLPPGPPEPVPDLTVNDLPVNVTVWAVAQDNGPISHYQVLVHVVKESTDTVTDWTKLGSDLYIAARIPFGDVNSSLVFALGDGKEYGGFVNKELSSGQKYNIYSRALTVKSKKRSTEDQHLTGEAALIAKIEVEKVIPIPNPTAKGQDGAPTAAIAASVVVVLVLVLVAAVVGVIFWRRRRRADERSAKSSETHAMTVVNVNGAYDTLVPDGGASQESTPKGEKPDAAGETFQDTSEPIYGNTAPEEADDTPKPIPVSQFSEYVTRLKRDKNAGFANQYKLLVTGQQFAWDVAKKPENKSKNRYGNIIAYDHSRVVLPFIEGVEHSDYVNANYLHGYDGTPKTYIACQGPVPGTFQDFWKMIWLENVSTIVMLTRLVEHGRTKCHQYWPENSETYHDITVTNHKTETFADYAIRTFVLCQNGSEKRRQVQQFHFLAWPDKGVPRHATAVLGLRRKVRAKHTDNKAPLVVHCSAGVGRTGAFVVIDAMMESAQNKKVVDVFNYVQLMRKNRISMVQTEEQYGFIYMALLEAITCGNTEVPAHDIRIAVKKLAAVNPKTKLSGLASEYQRLDLITADDVADREDEAGRSPENAAKNRFPDIVPLDGSRVFLKGDEKNNYINASFVDTFRERNAFIMTQAPMDNTIQDFWKMVWDYNIGTIVMLNEQNEKGQVYPIYWPSEGSEAFGEFAIETTSHEIFQDFSEREFTLAHRKNPKTVRHVQHYQVTGWPDKGIPKNAHCVLDLINMVERAQRKTKNAPVVVQCSDGVGRSGTFCAILSIIERLKSEQVIDVLQSVKVIRVNRPRAVNSKAQYVFCYNIVQKYLDSFNDYANFN